MAFPPAAGQLLINLSPASTARFLESGEKLICEILRAKLKGFCNSKFEVGADVAVTVGKSIWEAEKTAATPVNKMQTDLTTEIIAGKAQLLLTDYS